MRYEGKRKSGKDPDIDVYLFSFGIQELKAFSDILIDVSSRMPRITETATLYSRMSNMKKVLEQFKKEEDKKF